MITEEMLSHFLLDTDENIALKQGHDIPTNLGIITEFTEAGKKYPLTPLFRIVEKGKTTPEHRHHYLELIFFIKGEGVHIIDEISYPVSPGEIFFINTSKKHHYRANDKEALYYLSFSFDPSMLNPSIDMKKLGSGIHYFLINPFFQENTTRNIGWLNLNKKDFFKLAMLGLSIINYFNESYPNQSDEIFNLFKSFIFILNKSYTQEISQNINLYQKREKIFWDLLEEINSHLSEKFTITDIARSLGIGRTKIAEIFKEIQGETIVEYIRRRRIEKAADLIRNSNMPISEIACESGFIDSSYFNKTFKTYYNQSPSNYRLAQKTDSK